MSKAQRLPAEPAIDSIYRILNDLTKRLGNTMWGSAAFDIEVGKSRHELYKLIQQHQDLTLSTKKTEMVKMIEGMKYMYEHHAPGMKGSVLCETCREVVSQGTPCKESPHYPCWKQLDDLLDTLNEGTAK